MSQIVTAAMYTQIRNAITAIGTGQGSPPTAAANEVILASHGAAFPTAFNSWSLGATVGVQCASGCDASCNVCNASCTTCQGCVSCIGLFMSQCTTCNLCQTGCTGCQTPCLGCQGFCEANRQLVRQALCNNAGGHFQWPPGSGTTPATITSMVTYIHSTWTAAAWNNLRQLILDAYALGEDTTGASIAPGVTGAGSTRFRGNTAIPTITQAQQRNDCVASMAV